MPEIKVKIKDKIEIINPNKNIRGKIVRKNLLLPLLLSEANTDGDTTAEKKIMDPIKKAISMLVIKMINLNYLDL